MTLRVAFTGGGTGGHIYPALAIDGALRAAFDDGYAAHFYGNRHGLEASLVTAMPLTFVPSAPLRRRFSLGTLRTIAANAAGVAVALAALTRFRPMMVIATGGYVCFPVVVAARVLRVARLLRCGIALLEINVTPGLTNRLLAPLVDEVWTTYAASRASFGRKTVVTGAPVRGALRAASDPRAARARLQLDPERTTIVVMGGSQGARSINEAVAALVTRRTLPDAWQVLHVSGERDHAYMQAEERELAAGNRVRLVSYLADPSDAYAAADVVVARAGASTLAELAATGTPAILIPYPHAADQHQAHNAALFAEAGAATVLSDAELDGDRLWWALRDVLEPDRTGAMAAAACALAPHDAAAAIVERVGIAGLRPLRLTRAQRDARVRENADANGGRP
ncbi:UDP-N-acetylglucosamine--N-acetylmuramyl-(pentapeptide) pyrophosphoryl-undecaprenol N-acetylglucosamine transferase [Vulcanimicrobium alpinum]|uniref:UDP-N-acetylglucosamine--N-acetylmuramyl-(pentapeptide) pyrophosphoryl-undecaprenol N-acetylglucosamine transferase n=1 Tax=Vulcanimicrobium alpinum TaxID=3016050 RepID=A0AAN1XZR1_UNVUL|nr:glycosyltransferase [Vulcanimicrobium alpinum]BDE07929.1 UDP-N-acetylglucosamine--N-acetylmuramyl-(pentapeptide) pyrophosphoryl-undecaprenol N-acetylglucosamine transferase [Vulcanimicrobium alpinum]